MLRRLLFISFFVIWASGSSQIVEIPDPVFKFGLVNYAVADLDGNGSFESDVDTNDDGEIQFSEAEAVIGLEVPAYTVGGIHIQSLEGIEAFINLEFLNCSQQEISSLDLTNLVELRSLECYSNQITELDITNNTLLEYLQCTHNPIVGSIVTANNPNLYYFVCGGEDSQITDLDVTQNSLLETLSCDVVGMETIDLSQNNQLKYLNFTGTSVTSINLSNNTALEQVGIGFTSIQNLSFNENIQLFNIVCEYNELLESIDVSANLNLVNLFCRFNQLSSVDVSPNPLLTRVLCEGNQLTYLNVNNGNNLNFEVMNALDNPNFMCIRVDDVEYSNSQECINYLQGWCKDNTASYSTFCELGIQDLVNETITIYPNPVRDKLFISSEKHITKVVLYNFLGQEMANINQEFDQIPLHQITKGVFLLKIFSIDGTTTKTIIKE